MLHAMLARRLHHVHMADHIDARAQGRVGLAERHLQRRQMDDGVGTGFADGALDRQPCRSDRP